MEDSEKKYPYQLEIGVSMYGRSIPVWVYDQVPEGMQRATSIREFYNGRQFLIRSRVGNTDEYLRTSSDRQSGKLCSSPWKVRRRFLSNNAWHRKKYKKLYQIFCG